MKKITVLTVSCAALLAGCAGQEEKEKVVTDQDYINVLGEYLQEYDKEKGITVMQVRHITVEDSVQYITYNLEDEYQVVVADKKNAWEAKLEDCKNDELANKLRHDEYMKKYEEAKRKYGNDLQHKNKIDSYLKMAQKLPATHEDYLKFDRARSYSFTRDAEALQAEYESFVAAGIDSFAGRHPLLSQYKDREKDQILAAVVEVEYALADSQVVEEYLVYYNSLIVSGLFENDSINIFNYNAEESAQ